jgi:energy-coupling factor transporter ATP-binding protein EcfA2
VDDKNSAYLHEIGGDVKGILGDVYGGDITFVIANNSEAEIHSRRLRQGSPFLGLNKFEPGDKDKFFGREQWIIELSNNLEQNNLLLLLGASGSGKSSLVQAGLIPYLSDQWGTSKLVTIIFVPDRNPFASFHNSLSQEYKNKASQFLTDKRNHLTLVNTIKSLKKESSSWIIFIDQFEELFTTTPKLERDKFIGSLIPLIQQQDKSIKLILTMRSDFLDNLREYGDLINDIEKQIRLIRDMTENELRLAIAEPAARNGVTFEKGLVEQIIDDFYQQAGSLPLLQYTLDLLWREDKPSENNRVLNTATYQAIGGVSGALQKQANYIYNKELNDEERKAAERIFIELIDLKVKEPISRRVEQSQFKNDKNLNKVLEKLIDSRLLVIGRYSSTVEVAHEELLRSWQVFQELIQEKEEIIILRSRLFSDAQQWHRLKEENNNKAQDELWIGSKLDRFHELIDEQEFSSLDEESKQFIQASDERKIQLDKERNEKEQQELKLERTQRELASQLLEKERTKNKFLLALIGATVLSCLAGMLGWLVWQGQEQERLLQLSIDINNGQLKPETIALLPKLIEKGNEYKKQGNIERAMSSYRDVLTLTSFAKKQIRDYITVNPSKYKNILEYEVDSSKYSQDEKRLSRLGEVEKQAYDSLIKIIEEHRIPKLEMYLRDKKYGEKIANKKPSEFEAQFTEGALQETYKILIIDLGADINKSGYIGNEEEAGRLPNDILSEIESLWRKYTNQKCGWFGQKDNLKAPECQPLKGATLSNLIFYGPADAEKRLEDAGIYNPTSNKCLLKSIVDLRQYLSENLNVTSSSSKLNEKPSQTIGNYLKITGGSGKITYSQYSQLIPVNNISINQVTGGYDPNNHQMRIEINGRLLNIYLLQPLTDNQPIKFVVKKITRNVDEGEPIYRFIPSYITIASEFITEGTLQKTGNQIQGTFKTEGEIWLSEFQLRYKGFVNGEFNFNVEPGQKSNIPPDIEGRILTSVVETCLEDSNGT